MRSYDGCAIDYAFVILQYLSLAGRMTVVTVSPKFQVVIPREVRERLGLAPGQKVQAIAYRGRVELIPLRPAKHLRGFLRGIATTVEREPDRF